MKEVGRANIADCFPVLKVVDPIGIRRRTGEYFGKLLVIFQGLVDQRLKMRDMKGYCGKSDMLDAMLDDENNAGEMYKDKIERLSVVCDFYQLLSFFIFYNWCLDVHVRCYVLANQFLIDKIQILVCLQIL